MAQTLLRAVRPVANRQIDVCSRADAQTDGCGATIMHAVDI